MIILGSKFLIIKPFAIIGHSATLDPGNEVPISQISTNPTGIAA
jgi:hypothetical protein